MKSIKKIILLAFIWDILALTSYAQNSIFQKTIGGLSVNYANAIAPTNDGGYIIAGIFYNSAVYLIKFNSVGDTLWTKTYTPPLFDKDMGRAVQKTSDGGYIIAGSHYNNATSEFDGLLIKTDAQGNIIWGKMYGGSTDDILYSVSQTTDGGYIASGYTRSFGMAQENIYLIRTKPDGDTLWTKVFGGDSTDISRAVLQTSDGGYMVAGETWSIGKGEGDFYLMKTDSLGNKVWAKTYGGKWYEAFYSMVQTNDGGYILSGLTESWLGGIPTDTTSHPHTAAYRDAYILHTDANGDTLWTRTYGRDSTYDLAYSARQTADGGYIIGGAARSFAPGIFDAFLIHTNSNGDTLWTKVYNTGNYDVVTSVHPHSDGGFFAAGDFYNLSTGEEKVYLLKTDVNGNTGCSEEDTTAIIVGMTGTITLPASLPTASGAIVLPYPGTMTIPADTITDFCKCVVTAFITASEDTICLGDSVVLNVSGGTSFLWNTGDTTASVTKYPGLTTLYYVTVSNDTCSDMDTFIVVVDSCDTGIGEVAVNQEEIRIFPNPANDSFTIFFNPAAKGRKTFLLYDLLGRKIMETTFTENPTRIETGHLPKGIYFYKIKLRDKIIGTNKLVIQ